MYLKLLFFVFLCNCRTIERSNQDKYLGIQLFDTTVKNIDI